MTRAALQLQHECPQGSCAPGVCAVADPGCLPALCSVPTEGFGPHRCWTGPSSLLQPPARPCPDPVDTLHPSPFPRAGAREAASPPALPRLHTQGTARVPDPAPVPPPSLGIPGGCCLSITGLARVRTGCSREGLDPLWVLVPEARSDPSQQAHGWPRDPGRSVTTPPTPCLSPCRPSGDKKHSSHLVYFLSLAVKKGLCPGTRGRHQGGGMTWCVTGMTWGHIEGVTGVGGTMWGATRAGGTV